MGAAVFKGVPDQLLQVVDPPHRGDGIGAEMGTHDQRLRIGVADAADAERARHFVHIPLKFGAERGILDVVNGPFKAGLGVVYRQAAPSRAQMGVVIHPEKQIGNAVVAGCHAKNAAHTGPPSISSNTE